MSDQMRQLSDIKWQATGVDGHTHHTCGEWMYTSDAPPVEADEYERMKQRAEAAEAKLKEWETAANNNDPYVTNGGYVEVEVLEAVKRRNLELLTRAEAAERQIVANEARITELTRLKDELAEDASRERQRAEARVVNWISAEDRLPETQLRVLAVMLYDGRKPRIIRAMHIPAKTVECLDWEFNDAVVYDSESERHYFGAGWYELMEEGEYDYVGPLSDSVTHWAEMPELPEYFRQ